MINEQISLIPEIDYLSKDYASFRQLMLDHLAARVPEWKEPSEADIGNIIVELLAYAGDYLSYYQDAIATEAYLGTARRRTSIKRHVRLLDYVLHEGCNARVWVYLEVSRDTLLPRGTPLLTRIGELANVPVISPGSPAYNDAMDQQLTVFETMYTDQLFVAHNTIDFFVEDGQDTTLPAGSTSALLCTPDVALKIGQALLFEEVRGRETGDVLDADSSHRHIVRLTRVTPKLAGTTSVVAIEWADEDALPFPLAIATHYDGEYIAQISVTRGNMLLADYGRTIHYEPLPEVTSDQRYRPHLMYSELTHCVPDEGEKAAFPMPASQAVLQDPTEAMPAITLFKKDSPGPVTIDAATTIDLGNETLSASLRQLLYESLGIVLSESVSVIPIYGLGWELRDPARKQFLLLTSMNASMLSVSLLKPWTLRRDLVSSSPLTNAYSVDMEENGRAYLHFCSENLGEPPVNGTTFVATYRVGRGVKGNVRADTLTHVIVNDDSITQVRNPLAARGGTNPQSLDEARLQATFAFQTQQSCVTTADFEEIVTRHPQVVKAVAQLRWTGSWYTVFIYIQRSAGLIVDSAFKQAIVRYLDDFRTAGYEIEVRAPYYVPLHIALKVRLKSGNYRSGVHKALMKAFDTTPDGFFYPGNFTFGQSVYLSQLIANAMSVHGVADIEVEQFQRLDTKETSLIEQIIIHPLEIVRLDNDERAPQNGSIVFSLEGGL